VLCVHAFLSDNTEGNKPMVEGFVKQMKFSWDLNSERVMDGESGAVTENNDISQTVNYRSTQKSSQS